MTDTIQSIAEAYIILSHRLDKHYNGLVDAHYGRATELKAQIDGEPVVALEKLFLDSEAILNALALSSPSSDDAPRLNYLRRQTVALQTIIKKKQGDPVSYREEARLCYGIERLDLENEADLAEIIRELDVRLEGDAEISERFIKWREAFELKDEELTQFIQASMRFAKEKTHQLFSLPENAVDVSLVREKPWAGYHWYRGNFQSLYELNIDVPTTIWGVLHTTTHEAYCGHHTEAIVKESELVRRRGFIEFSVNLLGAPCSTISEGIAEAANHIIIGDTADVIAWLRENERLHRRPISDNDARIIELIENLGRKPTLNAALLMYDEHASDEAVFDYLRRFTPSEDALIRRTVSRLRDDDFRAYMLTYSIGKSLILNELIQSQNPTQTFYDILQSPDYSFRAQPVKARFT